MNKKTKRTIMIIATAVLLIAAAVIIFLIVRANRAGYRSISIAEIFGKVMTQNNGKTYEAYKNMRLADGYELTTEPDSYTRLLLDDDKYVKLEQESHAVFEALGDSKRHFTTIRLDKGALTTEITKPLNETESYIVNTPNAVLAVRGTMFRVEVKQETNGDFYCDVYTYGGSVVSHRIMPDGTHVDEEIVIPAGYKATVKMDEVITVYLEERIEEVADNIDPLHISDVIDGDLVDVYNASRHGHEMFLPTEELWEEISDRNIDLSKYKSVYDGNDILPFTSNDIDNSGGVSDSSDENSESSSVGNDSDLNSEISSSSTLEDPEEVSSYPAESDDYTTLRPVANERPPQSSASSPSSEPTPSESGESTSTSSDSEHESSEETSSGTTSSSGSDRPTESSSSSSGNTEISPPEVHTHTPVTTTVPATCTEAGKTTVKCSTCGAEISSESSAPLGHNPKTVTTPSTCTEHGREQQICQRCNGLLGNRELPLAEHTEVTTAVPATCTEAGKTTVKCSTCGAEISSETLAPLGHNPETVSTPSTCTKHGEEKQICSRCDAVLGSRELPLAEHTEVTETEGNIETVKCSICGEIITQTDLATGITYPIKISGTFYEPVPQSIADSDTNNDGKLSLDECRAVTKLSFGEGETTGDILEQLVIFPALANINITVMITDGNLSIGAIDGLIVDNISNVIGGTYPSDVPGLIRDITAGAEVGCDFTMNDDRTIPVRFVPAEGSTFAPETPEIIYPVPIDEEHFPDEEFREYYVKTDIDDGDGMLTQEECDAVTEIDVERRPFLTTLKGIEYFTKLESLQCGRTALTELDISKNIALTWVDCSNTQIASLDISENTALLHLDCSNTPLTELDVSNNNALTVLRCYDTKIASLNVNNNTELISLNCRNTQITSLDVSNNIKLASLSCANTLINSLDISNNTDLWQFYCNNTLLTSLDVSKNTALGYFDCSNTKIAFVDIINNSNVSYLNVEGNKHPIHVENGAFDFKSIDGFDISRIVDGTLTGATMDANGVLSGITEGTYIAYTYDCKGTGESAYQAEFTLVPDESSTFAPETPEITYPVPIDEEHFPDPKFREYVAKFDSDTNGKLSQEECEAVTEIDVRGSSFSNDGGITSLKGVENFSKLKTLRCGYNSGLTELDVSNNTALTSLNCYNTQITSLDVSKNTALRYLFCYNTQITSLDVSKNTALTELGCYYTQITSLDVSKNTALTYLNCNSTQVTTLDVSKNTALKELNCCDAQITSLDVSKNTALTQLGCSGTKITSLDVSKNTALTDLWCHTTQITSLDVSKNTALTRLNCHTTQITSLDVSKNTALDYLVCSNTQITTLDVSKNTALTDLYCYNTQITSLDVSKNTSLTTLWCYNTQITSLDVSNNTALTYLDCYNTQITSLDVSKNTVLKSLWCYNTQIPFVDISNNPKITLLSNVYGNKYPIPADTLQFDVTTDPNFAGFDPNRVSNVQGADFSPESGIFDNFTADEITYKYDCKGTGESTFMKTFTLVRTAAVSTASISADDEDDNFTVLPPDDTDTTPPPSSADTGAAALPEDAALPPEDIEGLRYLPLGILALMRDRKRKKLYVIRKAQI